MNTMVKLMTVLVAAMALIGCNLEVSSDAPATTSTAVSAKEFTAIQMYVADASLKRAMSSAQTLWSEAAGLEFETVGYISNAICVGSRAKMIRVYFGNAAGNSAMTVKYGNCQDIIVDSAWFANAHHRALVMTHEMGHAVTDSGDNHPCESMLDGCKAIMNHYIGETVCLTEIDSNWFQALMGYPLAPACVFED